MNGFRCTVTGGSSTAILGAPKPPKWCPDGDCVSGPKQPMYWANDNSNIDFSGEYEKKPSYNMKWGFPDGAQEIAVAGNGGANGGAIVTTTGPATTTTTDGATTLKTVTRTRFNTPTPIPDEKCSWPGHCAGATCVSSIHLFGRVKYFLTGGVVYLG
jgi:hypothetical protein